jgi:hypothetical protein
MADGIGFQQAYRGAAPGSLEGRRTTRIAAADYGQLYGRVGIERRRIDPLGPAHVP